ncbi:MAG: hypothetical protein IPK96_07750 [Flammeovirgaceae bacterium]|nr:hypothetical protein [Flammeovirgaceae bacterium]
MFKNYLKTAFRNLIRQRATTLLNIGGLTLGLATSLILFLLVRYHKSFDTFHSNYHRIYRAVVQSDGNDGKNYTPGVYPGFPERLQMTFQRQSKLLLSRIVQEALLPFRKLKLIPNGTMKRGESLLRNPVSLMYLIERF